MAFTDHTAAASIRELREGQGYNSPEALAAAIKLAAPKSGWGHRGTVDAWSIRAIEDKGHVPGPRIRFVLASYFGREVSDIWVAKNWKVAGQPVATRKRVPA